MAITVTLSERLSAYLLAQADRVHLPVDALVEQLLTAALPLDETNGYHALAADDAVPALAEVVALIKATPPNPAAIERGDKVNDLAYVQDLLDNPPTDTLTAEEWAAYWPAFEQELKELDRAQAIAEGRL